MLVSASATPDTCTLSLHDALPISGRFAVHQKWLELVSHMRRQADAEMRALAGVVLLHHLAQRSEEHTSELQSLRQIVCRLRLEKKKPTGGYRPSVAQTRRAQAVQA